VTEIILHVSYLSWFPTGNKEEKNGEKTQDTRWRRGKGDETPETKNKEIQEVIAERDNCSVTGWSP